MSGGRLPRWAVVVVSACLLASTLDERAAGAEPAANDDAQDVIYFGPTRPIVIRLHLRVDGRPFSELRKQIARQIFESLDADGNGVLEGKELAAIPTADLLAAAGEGGQTTRSAGALRKDRVTPDELSAWLMPIIGSLFAIGVETGGYPAGNGPATTPAAIRQNGYQQDNNLDMASFLAVLDADGDGRVTVTECQRVDELFHLLDLNDDETISRAEIAEVASAKSPTRMGTRTPLSGVASLLEPVDRMGSLMGAVRKLTDKYRRMSQSEAVKWLVDSAPQIELDVDLPKKTLQRPVVLLHPGSARLKEDGLSVRGGAGNGVVLQLGALPIALHAAESPPHPVSRTAYFKGLFKRADRDNNDYLDASEFGMASPGLGAAQFKAVDRDHNGMVVEDEWLAFMTVYDVLNEHRITLTLAATATDPIAAFDSNGDGRLTHGEWVRALATIRSWDANHDGVISLDEMPRHFEGTFHLGTLSRSTNRRGMSEMGSPRDSPASTAPAWFQKMDRNRDGEVSLREFLGPLSVFRRLDANHDGYLDPSEARSPDDDEKQSTKHE